MMHASTNTAADQVARMSGAIKAKINQGDPVVVNAPNGYEFFLICMAIIRGGGIAVPVNPQMREEEIEYVKDDSGASLIVHSADELQGEPEHGTVVYHITVDPLRFESVVQVGGKVDYTSRVRALSGLLERHARGEKEGHDRGR